MVMQVWQQGRQPARGLVADPVPLRWQDSL